LVKAQINEFSNSSSRLLSGEALAANATNAAKAAKAQVATHTSVTLSGSPLPNPGRLCLCLARFQPHSALYIVELRLTYHNIQDDAARRR